jgi:hypothetical protein
VLSGSVIMVRRHSTTDMAFLALNFAGTESTVCADTSAPEWDRIVDSADPRLGGDGVGCPAELGAAEEFMLPGYGFCCYLARIDQ